MQKFHTRFIVAFVMICLVLFNENINTIKTLQDVLSTQFCLVFGQYFSLHFVCQTLYKSIKQKYLSFYVINCHNYVLFVHYFLTLNQPCCFKIFGIYFFGINLMGIYHHKIGRLLKEKNLPKLAKIFNLLLVSNPFSLVKDRAFSNRQIIFPVASSIVDQPLSVQNFFSSLQIPSLHLFVNFSICLLCLAQSGESFLLCYLNWQI